MVFLLLALLQLAPQPPVRTIAITIDDLPTASAPGDLARAQRTTSDLLGAIKRAGVPAIGFVNEGKLASNGTVDPRRVALLQQWIDAGLELGNHTFSHVDLHRTDLKMFQEEIIKGEAVTRRLLEAKGQKPKYFRHPFLHTGRSLDVRNGLVAFLETRGYIVAPVTIDNYDYIFAAAYDRLVARGDAAAVTRLTDAYLDYMEACVVYYEQQSVAILGREIAQTLLIHASALNAATLESLVERIRRRGYRFVTLSDALQDPAYALKDEYVGPAGITWLHRWALTQGKTGIFAGEPVVPAWVEAASKLPSR